MSLHINRFLDRVKSAENRGQRELVLSLAEARDLHMDLTRVLLALKTLQEQRIQPDASTDDTVEIDGGRF
jgi:hypothetical protein